MFRRAIRTLAAMPLVAGVPAAALPSVDEPAAADAIMLEGVYAANLELR